MYSAHAPAFLLHAALLCSTMLCCVTLTSISSGAQQSTIATARDYEDCAERLRAPAHAKETAPATIAECDSRFPGRRKPGGGYTYYDFMQNRHFDIAGPVPTAKELKQIDKEFIRYLAARNPTVFPRDAELLQPSNIARRSKPGAPAKPTGKQMVPRTAAAQRNEIRHAAMQPACRDTPLACGWMKFTSRVKTIKDDLFSPPSREMLISRLQNRDR
jgi:hypothetical protein